MKKINTMEELDRACKSAGLSFVGLYMEALINRINELRDDLKRTKLIEEIFDNGNSAFDSRISGTRTRVNCLYRIIESGMTISALEKVVDPTRMPKENHYAVEAAEELLRKIHSGEIELP